MKTKEWELLGFLFMGLMLIFIYLDLSLSVSCIEWTDLTTCIILSEIYDPFIFAFAGIWVICLIMAFVSWREGKKNVRKKLVDAKMEMWNLEEKSIIMEASKKLGIKQMAKDFPEFLFYAEQIGKKKEAEMTWNKLIEKHTKELKEISEGKKPIL